MATRVGKLNVLIGTNTRGLQSGLKRSQGRIRGFARSVNKRIGGISGGFQIATRWAKRFGVAATAAAVGVAFAAKQAADRIDDMAKTSRRLLGISRTGPLAGIRLAAEEAGVEITELDRALERMGDTLGAAKFGDTAAVKAFAQIGISGRELQKLSPEQALLRVADAIGKIDDESQKIAAARDIFGRTGAGLINLFNGGADAIEEATRAAIKFNLGISKTDAAKVEKMNDAFGRTGKQLEGITNQIAVRMAPGLTLLNEEFEKFIDSMGGAKSIGDTLWDSFIDTAPDVLDALEEMVAAAKVINDLFSSIKSTWDKLPTGSFRGLLRGIAPGGTVAPEAFGILQQNELQKGREKSGGLSLGDRFRQSIKGSDRELTDRQKSGLVLGPDGSLILRADLEKQKQRNAGVAGDESQRKADRLAALTQKRRLEEEKAAEALEKQKRALEAIQGQQAGQDFGRTAFSGPATTFAVANRQMISALGGQSDEARQVTLLEQINNKLGRGVPMVYA